MARAVGSSAVRLVFRHCGVGVVRGVAATLLLRRAVNSKEERSVRILHLVNAIDRDQLGGMQRYAAELASALTARGHDVTVATKRLTKDLPPEERLPSGVCLLRLDVPSRVERTYALRYPTALILRTARLVSRGGYDVVHAQFAPQGFACRLARRPYVYTFQAPAWAELTEERGGRYAWPSTLDGAAETAFRVVERAAVSGAAKRIVLSDFMQGELRSLAPRAPQADLIPGGVDTDFFSPGYPASLAGDPWAGDEGRVLFCARRLVPRTGVLNLVRALPDLLARMSDLRVAIAGTGFLRDEIVGLIASTGIGDRVRLLGRVPDEQLRDWYRRATLVVVPTAHLEGFGLSTAEALACGTAVVGTAAGATPELLAQVDAGLIAPDGSPAALRAAIASALARGPQLAEFGSRGRALAEREWSWSVVAERHEPIFEALLRARGDGRVTTVDRAPGALAK